ncbi:MAG: hypothetical protein K5799_05100 [Erythrobacter sp.]|nr:hypothetical protein [Erythrobacter sp.]
MFGPFKNRAGYPHRYDQYAHIRYDQLADSFLSMVHLASARYWIKFVHATYGIANSGSSMSIDGDRRNERDRSLGDKPKLRRISRTARRADVMPIVLCGKFL